MKYIYLQTTNKRQFSELKRTLDDIKFIVIHDTGNSSKGADAMAHYRYLQSAQRLGSAHYYVDDTSIVQTIGDSRIAWSVGDNQGYGIFLNGCNNSNSISIEMCVNLDANLDYTYKNVLELTKNLMKKFNIPANRVCRHYDVSRKMCPRNFAQNNWQKWWIFKEQIKKPIEWPIDLSKNSEFGNIEKREDKKEMTKFDEEYQEATEIGITDGTRAEDKATRKEVAVMVLRALKLARGEKPE